MLAGIKEDPAPGAVVAGNVVVLRCNEGAPVTHVYAALGGGLGVNAPNFTGKKKWIKEAVDHLDDALDFDWTDFSAETPFNLNDLNGASFDIVSAEAGVGVGWAYCRVSAYGQVDFRDAKEICTRGRKDFFSAVTQKGFKLVVGLDAEIIGGPLIMIS